MVILSYNLILIRLAVTNRPLKPNTWKDRDRQGGHFVYTTPINHSEFCPSCRKKKCFQFVNWHFNEASKNTDKSSYLFGNYVKTKVKYVCQIV